VADQLKKIGINVKIRQLETGVFIKETSAEGGFNFDMQPNAFTPRHDPDGFVYRFHSSQETALGYKNERLDDLLIKGRTTIDPAKRKEYYDEVQRILLTDLPLVWLGVDNVIEGVRTTVKGYTQSPFTRRDWGLKHAWLEK
jgi:peptide/nickel transport system substrate-binding protein